MAFLVRGVGKGIGLASEVVAHHTEKKRKEKESQRLQGEMSESSPGDSNAPVEDKDNKLDVEPQVHLHGQDDDSSSDESEVDGDEAVWQLDEAAQAIRDSDSPDRPPDYEEREYSVNQLVDEFTAQHPPPAYSPPVTVGRRLAAPVILPQKRPQTKSRGFVRAYAPALADCGIDQRTFLDFLDDFDKSTKADSYINVINMAGGILGFVPDPICIAVSVSIQVAAGTAKAVQGARRTNTFLDQMNEKLFRPHGLFCLLMTYKPDAQSSGEPVLVSHMISRSITPADSSFKQELKLLKATRGKTRGDMELPEAAPLIYPSLDEVVKEGGEKKNMLIRSSEFIASYEDRRTQAKWAHEHPGSKLAAPEQPKFASRYSDPNHPANSGSLISLVTGGHINPAARKHERRIAKRERKRARSGQAPLTESEKRRRRPGRRPGLIKRVLTQDVVYMMIVNMPSKEEMNAAMAEVGGPKMDAVLQDNKKGY